jgi:hypothetical protein
MVRHEVAHECTLVLLMAQPSPAALVDSMCDTVTTTITAGDCHLTLFSLVLTYVERLRPLQAITAPARV